MRLFHWNLKVRLYIPLESESEAIPLESESEAIPSFKKEFSMEIMKIKFGSAEIQL